MGEFAIRSSEPKEQEEKWNEAEREKNGAAAVMKRAVNDVGIPVRGRHGKDVDAESVSNEAEREDGEGEHPLFPGGAEEHVASDKAGNEENEARANAATFLRYDDGEIRKNKSACFAKIGGAGKVHHPGIDFGRTELRGDLESVDEEIGERD